MSNRPLNALIIGGGIAGPATAMALHQAGIGSVIYEANQTSADDEGSFLTLAANGINALRIIRAEQPAIAAGFETPGMILWSGTGKRLGSAILSMTLDDGTTGYTMKRADLYAAIRNQALGRGLRIEYGKRLVGVANENGGVRATFADGSEAIGDLLIGCDGIHSVVRRLIDVHAPAPTYAGLIGLGGFAHGVEVNAEVGTYHMIFGKRAFFGYALAPNGEVWWFANVPQPQEPTRGALASLSSAAWQAKLSDMFADDAGPAARLIQATSHLPPPTPIHTLPHLPRWHSERMIVIGDAAHAPSASSGQGASISIEDAVVLGKCLRDQPNPEHAFVAFEQLRRPRVERIIKAALRVNNSKAATGVARVIRDLTLPLILKLTANSGSAKEVFGYRVDWGSSASTVGDEGRQLVNV